MLKTKTFIVLLLTMLLGTSAVIAEASPVLLPTNANYIFKLDLTNITNLNIGFYGGAATNLAQANFLEATGAGEYAWQTANSISINTLDMGAGAASGTAINRPDAEARAKQVFYIYFGIDSKKKISLTLHADPLKTSNGSTSISYTLNFNKYYSKNTRNAADFVEVFTDNTLSDKRPGPLQVGKEGSNYSCDILQKAKSDSDPVLQGYYEVELVTEPLSAKPLIDYYGNITLQFAINE